VTPGDAVAYRSTSIRHGPLVRSPLASWSQNASRAAAQAYAWRGGEIVAVLLAEVVIRAKIEPIEWAQWLDVVFKQKNYGLIAITQPEPWDIFKLHRRVAFLPYSRRI
jgi:hypothetical protein